MLLLVLRDEKSTLKFFIHKDFRSIVREQDVGYIESVLRDLPESAKCEPVVLFNHLCSLSVGPLVTHEIGWSLADSPSALEISSQFVNI